MSKRTLPSVLYGAILMIALNSINLSATLCESRCENAVPHLRRLKTLWHHYSKREGGDGKFYLLLLYLCLVFKFESLSVRMSLALYHQQNL